MNSDMPLCLVHASENFSPNDEVILAQNVNLSIEFPSKKTDIINIRGDILLRLLPKPRLHVLINENLKDSLDKNLTLIVRTNDLEFCCNVTNIITKNQHDSKTTLSSVDNRSIHSDVINLKYITFYVINFPMSFGDSVCGRDRVDFFLKSRLMFFDDQWQVVMDKMENYETIKSELKEKDGYAYTYAGILEKVNGESFGSREAHLIINRVYNFLSFIRGAYTPPFYLKGFDDKNELIWKDWSMRKCDRWNLCQDNWYCDIHSSQQIKKLNPGWSKLFDDELWQNEIPKILYWYYYAGRNSDGAGTDGSLIIAIAALELFTYNYLVRKSELRSKEKFEKKNLGNNIYSTLKELNIPANLPDRLNSLHSYSHQKNWQTGPKAIVEVRNEIVHPDRESAPNGDVCYEALQLALWYLEMLILRLCNYEGSYSNRLHQPKWKGVVEKVPFEPEE